jgi:hypothetical protein
LKKLRNWQKQPLDIGEKYGIMDLVTSVMLFLKGRTMKTKKNLSHNHDISGAATVSVYDGWRETVTVTIRDESDEGSDEVSIELPTNVFESLASKLNKVVEERQEKLEESEVE